MGSTASARAEIVACETCGKAELDASGRTRGEGLIALLRMRLSLSGDVGVDVSSVRCLWACARSCAVFVRSPERVGYVIAGLEPTEVSAQALIDYAALYVQSTEGAVPYKQWPAALKGHFHCRIPAAPQPQGTASLTGDEAPEPPARIDREP
jgi:predicted metal-binding protein